MEKLLASGETHVRDGKSYQFLDAQGYVPCWWEVGPHGEPVDILGSLALGLDPPFPEDARAGKMRPIDFLDDQRRAGGQAYLRRFP